ncbi:MAG: hypothetical protein QMD12_02960 [Candidatus Aenigmarchaeota archaeon]|nr:hypothetical protein [Candidatus Aenigmarchaeota archaeon]
MSDSNSIEEIYISSAKKLRAGFPKFVIFLGLAYLVWLIGTTFFIPLGRGAFIGAVEASRIDSLILLGAVLALLFASFVEMKNVADACAGLVTSYIGHESEIEEVRLKKVKRTFNITGYILPTTVSYLIFNNLIEQINPMLNTIIPIVIAIWVVIASILLALVLGSELEEAAKVFVERLKRIRKK